jgi:FMN phosphatase YigB (HAD superfamily)
LWKRFTLAAIIDTWAPKIAWLKEFECMGILDLFSATSFSSDHSMVKRSPRPFELVLSQLGVEKSQISPADAKKRRG